MSLHRLIRVGKQVQTKITNISLVLILSLGGLAGSAPLFLTQKVSANGNPVVITEFMADPSSVTDTNGEWVELLVNQPSVDLSGWKVVNSSPVSITPYASGPTIFSEGSFIVICRNGDPLANGGITCDFTASSMSIINSPATLSITNSDDEIQDSVSYTSTSSGEASYLNHAGWQVDNDRTYGTGDTGTPGRTNDRTVASSGADYTTLQAAINASSPGDVIQVVAGTYVLGSTLNINKDGVEIIGDDQATTIIDATGVSGYGILWTADNVSLSNLTLEGSTSGTYGLKIQADPAQGTPFSTPVTGVNLSDVKVRGFNVNEVDLHFVDGAVLTNVTADGNGTGGVGIAATDSTNIQILNAVTTDNAWGGVAMYTGGCCVVPGGSSNITITYLDADESNPFYVEEENSGLFDFGSLNAPQFSHTVTNEMFRPDAPEFTFFQESESQAVTFGAALNQAPGFENDTSLVREWPSGNLVVGDGMYIQAAIEAAGSGDTVNVLAGDYSESININKALTLNGPQASINTALRTPGGSEEAVITGLPGQNAVTIASSGVSVSGFSITSDSANGIYGVAENGAYSATVVQNNFVYDFSALGIAIGAGSSGGQITSNEIWDVYAGAYLSTGANNFSVQNNQIEGLIGGAGPDQGAAVVLEGNNTNVNINGNNLTNNAHGIYVWDFGSDFSGTMISGNSLAGNTIGITSTNSGILTADDNWWGSNLGPANSQISGSIDASSWCSDSTCTPPFLSAVGGIVTLSQPLDLLGLFDGTQATFPGTQGTNDVVLRSLLSGVTLNIVGGTTVTPTVPGSWNGQINPPTVLSNTSVSIPTPSGFTTTVATVVELGSSGTTLNFNVPVRLLIPGQAGTRTGFVPAGSSVFTEIATDCGADDLVLVTILLGLPTPDINECKMSVGDDLVIWTNHLTKFVTYTQTADPASGGSGSSAGSGSSTSTPVFRPAFFAQAGGADSGVLGSSTEPKTSSTSTEDNSTKPPVAQIEPGASGKLFGLMWYWWLVVLMITGAMIYGIYRMADVTTDRK